MYYRHRWMMGPWMRVYFKYHMIWDCLYSVGKTFNSKSSKWVKWAFINISVRHCNFMYFLSCSECTLDYKTSENWLRFMSFFSQRNVPVKTNTEVELSTAHAQCKTHIPVTLHTINSPQRQTRTPKCEDIRYQHAAEIFSYKHSFSHLGNLAWGGSKCANHPLSLH